MVKPPKNRDPELKGTVTKISPLSAGDSFLFSVAYEGAGQETFIVSAGVMKKKRPLRIGERVVFRVSGVFEKAASRDPQMQTISEEAGFNRVTSLRAVSAALKR